MWRIGLILLLFSRIESLQCPERCDCVETTQLLDNGVRSPTFQVKCRQLHSLHGLLRHLPSPTTQLIIHFATLDNVHEVVAEAAEALPHLTDFSITNSVVSSQGDQLIKEFLPFASITNPVLVGAGFSQLQILNLSNNTLRYLPAGLFRSCSSLQTLDLSDNLIKNLETDTFHPLINLLRLDLRRNCLQALNEDVFRSLSKLLTLDVSHNEITRITPTTFQYLPSLNTLILAGNHLSTGVVLLGAGRHLQVVDVSATGLHQAPATLERTVRTLILKGNQMSSVRCGDLDSYSLLSSIYLDNNRISFVEDDAMGRLELLDELHLSHNSLFHVPTSLPENLVLMDLSYNLIQNVSNSDFLNLSLLKELSVNNNQIRFIEENSFVNLASLRTLDISRNPILVLPPLTGLTQLRVLNLSYLTNVSRVWRLGLRTFPVPDPSNIEQLYLEASPTLSSLFLSDTATLQEFFNLTELHLRLSNLTTLRRDIFMLLPSLVNLHLEGNPWHCDREMLVTAEWMQAHATGGAVTGEADSRGGGDGVSAMHCATPLALHGKPLIQLSRHDFPDELSGNPQPAQFNALEILKTQPTFKRVEVNPSNARIYLKSYENSIESIHKGNGEIEKTSNALRGYLKKVLPVAGEEHSGDNDSQLNSDAALLPNTSVTAIPFATTNHSSSKPIDRSLTPFPPPTATPSPFFTPTHFTAIKPTRHNRIESRTTPIVPTPTTTTPVKTTLSKVSNISETWTGASKPRTTQPRASSLLSSRLTGESLKNNTVVPSGKSCDNETECWNQRSDPEGEGTGEGKPREPELEPERQQTPPELESTTPADLGAQWDDTSAVLSDGAIKVNKSGVGALSALQPMPGLGKSNSHSGLLLLALVAVVMAVAFVLMGLHLKRKTRAEGYVLQDQEMEIHSISNFANNELW